VQIKQSNISSMFSARHFSFINYHCCIK
jgi:hypothetical protein